MALAVPVMDTTRARTELGWEPTRDAGATLLELLEGMRDGADDDLPPLEHDAGGTARTGEVRSGVGARG
jgi:hypothetical protein